MSLYPTRIRNRRTPVRGWPMGDLDQIFSDFLGEWPVARPGNGGSVQSLALDVVESENGLAIKADLPGIAKEDVHISLDENVLTIAFESGGETEEKEEDFIRRERWKGSGQRSITLPGTLEFGKVNAELTDGVLTVSIPKQPEKKPKKITVA